MALTQIKLGGLAAESVDSDAYVDGSIDLAHLSADSVDSTQYVDGSIDNAHLADDAVDSDELAAGSVDAAHLAAGVGGVSGITDNSNANAITIDSSENVAIDSGNLVISTHGKGIDFSANTDDAGGMTDEILDDYEEGTWTPVLSDADADNATPATGEAVGTYTKIGDFVSVRWYYTCSSLGDVNNGVRFTGLPFTAKNVTHDKGVFVAAVAGNLGISSGQNIGGFCQPNQSFLYLETWDAGTGSTEMAESEFSDDGSITMFGNYHTA